MRTLKGTVVSSQMQKTAVVLVDRLKKHPRYGKYYRVSKKVKAHDGESAYRVGDHVTIEETRPLSKEKRWKIVGLIRRAEATEGDDARSESGGASQESGEKDFPSADPQ